MSKENLTAALKHSLEKQLQRDARLKNAYLLVSAKQAGLHFKTAAGTTGDMPAHADQPNYMASVGKLFTAVLIGILYEKGKLSFHDRITNYLDNGILEGLHVYKEKNYTNQIQIKHLLNHTSGLNDHFWPLLEKVLEQPDLQMTPQAAVQYTKDKMKAIFPPGKGFNYTDTNYHLLGFIIENITGEPFHAALKKYIFEPLAMNHSYMLHYSKPVIPSQLPVAEFVCKQTRLNDSKAYAAIDYSGGGVVATMDDLLCFMRALTDRRLVSEKTLAIMKNDYTKFGLGINYGYGIWQFTSVTLLMPKSFNCWGVAGATGAFMFYHPVTDAYIIGNFNDLSYEKKGVKFMLLNVIKQLTKHLK